MSPEQNGLRFENNLANHKISMEAMLLLSAVGTSIFFQLAIHSFLFILFWEFNFRYLDSVKDWNDRYVLLFRDLDNGRRSTFAKCSTMLRNYRFIEIGGRPGAVNVLTTIRYTLHIKVLKTPKNRLQTNEEVNERVPISIVWITYTAHLCTNKTAKAYSQSYRETLVVGLWWQSPKWLEKSLVYRSVILYSPGEMYSVSALSMWFGMQQVVLIKLCFFISYFCLPQDLRSKPLVTLLTIDGHYQPKVLCLAFNMSGVE